MEETSARVEFGDGDVSAAPGKIDLKTAGDCRVADTEYIAAGVEIPFLVVSGGIAPVVGGGSGIGGKNQNRVDNERQRRVVCAELKSELMPVDLVSAFHRPPSAVLICLIGNRFQFQNLHDSSGDYQVAFDNGQALNAFVVQRDLVGRCARCHRELIFQMEILLREQQVNPLIQVFIGNFMKNRNMGCPSLGIFS